MKYDKEKIKQIILTDYLDNRLDDAQKKEIEAYIDQNEELKAFFDQALDNTIKPFSESQKIQAPPHIWEAIEDKLDRKQKTILTWPNVIDKLWKTWTPPQMAWLALSIIFVLFVSWHVYQNRQLDRISYDKEAQIEYLMLLADASQLSNDERTQDEIDLEKFFL